MPSHLIGYADRMGQRQGGPLILKWSSAIAASVDVSFHRVEGCRWTVKGAKPSLKVVPHPQAGAHPSAFQPVPIGSYALAPAPSALAHSQIWSFGALVQPSAKTPKAAVIACLAGSRGDMTLGLDESHCPTLQVEGKVMVRLDMPLKRGIWAALTMTVSGHNIELSVTQSNGTAQSGRNTASIGGTFDHATFAAALNGCAAHSHFDGRIEAPTIAAVSNATLANALWQGRVGIDRLGPQRLAAWDFAQKIETQTIVDTGPARQDGRLINRPARAVTGAFWRGAHFDWRTQPNDYAAIHFHGDDLDDCDWDDRLSITIPEDWRPGLYVARLQNQDGMDLIPFAVRSKQHDAAPRLAFLMPTFTYLSYGNARNAMRGPDFDIAEYPDEDTLAAHPLGLSQYDLHSDRSPAMFSYPCVR